MMQSEDIQRKNSKISKLWSFIDCTSKINNTQIDYEKYLDVVVPMYNLIEYSNSYSKTSENL